MRVIAAPACSTQPRHATAAVWHHPPSAGQEGERRIGAGGRRPTYRCHENAPHDSLRSEHPLHESTTNGNLLFPIARAPQSRERGSRRRLPCRGVDIGMPTNCNGSRARQTGRGDGGFQFLCRPEPPKLIEAKRFKLYLNSYNQTHRRDSKPWCPQSRASLEGSRGAAVAVSR